MDAKAELRSRLKAQRLSLTEEELFLAGKWLSETLPRQKCWSFSDTLYVYLPIQNEVPTVPLIEAAWRAGKKTAAPVVHGNRMDFMYFDDFRQLRKGAYGIWEPDGSCEIAHCENSLVLVPGLAFDRRGYRLGYGGGYYDRFLSLEPLHFTIAPCFDFQLLELLPSESHDLPVRQILCSSGETVFP